MTFLAPLWLLGLASLALPLWLHLRDRRPPDVVRVGSVADLMGGPAVHQRRRLREPLLFALRCALLILASLALAAPMRDATDAAGRRVFVVPGDLVTVADSLAAAGHAVLQPTRSVAPWVALEAAVPHTAPTDTLVVLAAAGEDRWLGPRPVVNRHVEVIPVGGTAVRPPHSQIAPRRGEVSGETLPATPLAPLLWWLALGVLTTERVLARRSRPR
jgi:hypothetical protein